jgi:hypothetical protein
MKGYNEEGADSCSLLSQRTELIERRIPSREVTELHSEAYKVLFSITKTGRA